jgi:hypothetical protein
LSGRIVLRNPLFPLARSNLLPATCIRSQSASISHNSGLGDCCVFRKVLCAKLCLPVRPDPQVDTGKLRKLFQPDAVDSELSRSGGKCQRGSRRPPNSATATFDFAFDDTRHASGQNSDDAPGPSHDSRCNVGVQQMACRLLWRSANPHLPVLECGRCHPVYPTCSPQCDSPYTFPGLSGRRSLFLQIGHQSRVHRHSRSGVTCWHD